MCMCEFGCTSHTVHVGNQRTTSGLPTLADLEMKCRSHICVQRVRSYLCHLARPLHNFVTDHWTVTSSKAGWKIPSWSPRKLTRLTRPRQLRNSQDSGGFSKVMWAANISWGRWHSSGKLPASWAGSSRDAMFAHHHPCSCLKVTRAAV